MEIISEVGIEIEENIVKEFFSSLNCLKNKDLIYKDLETKLIDLSSIKKEIM